MIGIDIEEAQKASSKATTNALFAPEDLAQTLSSIQTILSLYADGEEEGDEEGDVDVDEANEAAIRNVAQFLRLPLATLGDERSTALRDSLPAHVTLGLRLHPWRGTERSLRGQTITLDVHFPLRRSSAAAVAAIAAAADGHETIAWPVWDVRRSPWLVEEHHARIVAAAKKAALECKEAAHSAPDKDREESSAVTAYVLLVAETITETAIEIEEELAS